MQGLYAILKYGLIVVLLCVSGSITAQQSISELKNKITENVFPSATLYDYEFFLLNNKINFESELSFLNNLKPSFETEYLQSLILYRKNEFGKSFNKLFVMLGQSPTNYSYFNLLVKLAKVTEKTRDVENEKLESIPKEFTSYLKAMLVYENGEYKKAKNMFADVLEKDSTSFYPNFMMAYTYRNIGDYNTALKYFNKAIAPFKNVSPQSAKVQIAIGSLFYLSGNYAKAKELYRSGLELATETNYTIEKIKAHLNLGMILDLEGAISAGRENFEKAANLATSIGNAELGATVLSEYAVSYTYTGEEVKARKKYEESLSLFEKQKNDKRFALTAVNIGNSFLNISNYKSAIKYFVSGLDKAGDNQRTQMLALRGLGDVYTNLANYAKAIHYYERAKNISKELKDVSADAQINIGLGVLYYNLDMPGKALKILKGSEQKLVENDNPYLKLEIEQKIGIVYSSLDSTILATQYLKSSATLAQKYGDIYSEILSNTFLADVEIKQGNLKRASILLNNSVAKAKAIGYKQIQSVQNILFSKIEENKVRQIELLENAIAIAESVNDVGSLIRVNQKLGQIYENKNALDEAENYYLNAIKLIEQNSNRLFAKAKIQIKYFSNYYPIYNSLVSIYLSENRNEAAFEILEQAKGRNTNQNLVNLQLDNSEKSEKLLDNYYDLKWKLTSGLYSPDEIELMHKELEEAEKSIAKINPLVEKYLNSKNSFAISNIQKMLDKNEFVISYFVKEKNIFAFKLSSDSLIVKKLDVSQHELYELKSGISPYYNESIGVNEITFNKDLFAFNANGSKIFYDRLLRPIISDISTNSKIIFSLPSEMLTLPFELLVTKSDVDSSPYLLDDKRFLVDDYTISYTPSAFIWSKLENEKSSNKQVALLIGDPFFDNQSSVVSSERGIIDEIDIASRSMEHLRLEYSEDEILSIGSLINDEGTYLSKDATETIFKKNVEDAAIVHLSTHSILYKNSPLILFSNVDEENDGFLEVGEILDLNLQSDMVVLSSCKSGLGKVDKAEGIIGMQKAFFDAGAKSVVVSLWDVNDKYTSIFMKYFYLFLSENFSKSEALRLAKIKFIKENNPNPYYWAAFTFSGNDGSISIHRKSDLFSFVIFGFFLMLMGLLTFTYVQKRKQ